MRQQYVTHPVGQITLKFKVRIKTDLRGKYLELQVVRGRRNKRECSLIEQHNHTQSLFFTQMLRECFPKTGLE